MALRSPGEIVFRLKQEAWNLWLCFGPAASSSPRTTPLPLPRPESFLHYLQDTPLTAELVTVAEACLKREFPLLGSTVQAEREIRWRRDYSRQIETGLDYFRSIPYLDATRVGDHKVIWELNRHQHLVAMVQASLLTGRQDFLDDVWYQLETWLDQNPFCRGMNWTSALEVAMRALSWSWIEHLAGPQMPDRLRKPWLQAFFQHGQYLQHNLSVYFSPNTHLQGEALALQTLGLIFSEQRWRNAGTEQLRTLVETHVRPDGSHFEQSSYYHVYALDMFLFHALLEPAPEDYRKRLRGMAGYLWALANSGEIPLLGDDDGGRLFHPFGNRRAFARGCLAACASYLGDTAWSGDPQDLNEQAVWWMGVPKSLPAAVPAASALFPDSGVAVLVEDSVQAIVDTRAFGFGSAGHSHAHALHFTLRRDSTDVLIDPGTYTYVGDPVWRDRFRGTASHNTVTIDGLDQAVPSGAFRWRELPETKVLSWTAQPWSLHAQCRYRGLRHERRMQWVDGVLFVADRLIEESEGSVHTLEQHWHAGGPVERLSGTQFQLPAGVRLVLPQGTAVELEDGWQSPAPGKKIPVPRIRVHAQVRFVCDLAAAFVFAPLEATAPLQVQSSPQGVTLSLADRTIHFSL